MPPPRHRGAHRRVERDVRVVVPGEPVARVLALLRRDERPRTPAWPRTLQRVARRPFREDLVRVDLQRRDRRRYVEIGDEVAAYIAALCAFFTSTSAASASSSTRRSTFVSRLGAGANGSKGSRWPSARSAAPTTSSAVTSSRASR